jgi:hypothetical protein
MRERRKFARNVDKAEELGDGVADRGDWRFLVSEAAGGGQRGFL